MDPADRAADAADPGSPATGEKLSFESALGRLGQIVDSLEKGDLSLERSLALFEEGVRLSRLGAERLENAEARVEQLLGGSNTTKTLAPDDRGATEPSSAVSKSHKEPR